MVGKAEISVLLLGDTHGTVDARIMTLLPLAERVVHTGDVGSGVARALRAGCAAVDIVGGNNDPADSGLPDELCLDLPGGVLAVEHGHRYPARDRPARLRRAYPAARVVVCGHSHRLLIDQTAAPWVLNPGAAGRTRTYGGPSCLWLTISETAWRVEAVRFALPAQPAV